MIASLTAVLVLVGNPGQQASDSRLWDGEDVAFLERPRPAFPMQARTNRGEVELICLVTARGTFRGCRIESETPRGSGFGSAAVASMQRGARIEMLVDGPAEGDRVRAKIEFWNGQ